MKLCAAMALLLSSAAPVLSQTVSGTQSSTQPSLRTQSNVVLVPALVRDAKGELVFSLHADDFSITDDGVKQSLTLDEDTGSEPLALVVVVESGAAGKEKLAAYRHLGAVLAAVVGGVPHRVAVVAYDSMACVVQSFTSNVDAAGDALGNLDPGDKGGATLDALRFSLDLLRSQPPNYRRAILLISETLDRGSKTDMDEVVRAISDTNTAIYSLGFSSGKAEAAHYAYHELPVTKTDGGFVIGSNAYPGPPHGCMGKDTDPDATQNKAAQAFDCLGLLAPPLALAKMAAIRVADGLQKNVPEEVANLTGGEYFKFENSRGLVRDLVTISNHVPNRYVLSFEPQSPHAGFHALELKLKDHPGLRVEARSGYWADSDAATGPRP